MGGRGVQLSFPASPKLNRGSPVQHSLLQVLLPVRPLGGGAAGALRALLWGPDLQQVLQRPLLGGRPQERVQ